MDSSTVGYSCSECNCWLFVESSSTKTKVPYQLELVSVAQGLAENAHKVWDFSFPSFQAMMVFCAVPLLSKEFPKFKYVWVIFACLVAFSRVYLGVHFLSDVIAGALIGYMIGYFIMRNVEGK